MTLISSKSKMCFHSHETEMHQCLPYFLLCTYPFVVHEYGKNKDFEKDTGRHTKVGSSKKIP